MNPIKGLAFALALVVLAGCGRSPTPPLPEQSTVLPESVQLVLKKHHQHLVEAESQETAPMLLARLERRLAMHLQAYELIDGAELHYQRAIALWPDHHATWHLLGVVQAEQDRHADALASFERAHRLDSHNPATAHRAGLAANSLGREADAARWFETAISNVPSYAASRYELGKLATNQKDYSTAILILGSLLNDQPKARNVVHALALAYRDAGDQANAEIMFERMSQLSEDAPRAFANDAVLRDVQQLREDGWMDRFMTNHALRRGDFTVARRQLLARLDKSSSDSEARYQLAAVLAHAGEYEQAENHLNRLLETAPDHQLALQLKAHIASTKP